LLLVGLKKFHYVTFFGNARRHSPPRAARVVRGGAERARDVVFGVPTRVSHRVAM
jgi:hypothetical protein